MSEISSELHPLTRLAPSQADLVVGAPGVDMQAEPGGAAPVATALRRRWVLVLCTWLVIAGGLSGFIWTHFTTEYEAVGYVRIAPSIRPVLFRDEESGILPFYNAYMMSQMQNLTSPNVLKRAVQSPEVKQLAWAGAASDPAGWLSGRLKIDNEANSELIAVSLAGPDPSELAPTVNAVLRAYQEKVTAEGESGEAAQLSTLRAEQAKLDEEIKDLHDQLYNFASEAGAFALGDQKDGAFSGIQQVQIELKKAQAARVAAEARLEALERRGPVPLAPSEWNQLEQEMIMLDPELASLSMNKQMDEQRLLHLQQLGPDHREARTIRERVQLTNRKIVERAELVGKNIASAAEARARAAFEAELRATRQERFESSQKEGALQEVVREDLATLSTMGRNSVQLEALRHKIRSNEALRDQVLQRIQHLEVERQRPARITIDSWAEAPVSPAKDKRPKLTILAVVAGLFMALSLGVLIDSRDTFVHSEEDVRRSVGLTVLGTRTIPSSRQVSNKDILAAVAEEIRGIRGCVLFAGGQQDFKSLLITSPNPQEGKTRTAGDLAVALADSGRQVLLIDADNRKRDLTRQLGAEARPGLSDLLGNGHDPSDFILETSTAGLSFLPAGPASEEFSELLVRPGQLDRIRDVFDQYDLVVVDSPPVLLSNDACIWARFIDSVLMVLRVKCSAREDALAAKQKLNRMGGRIMGAVLNGVEPRNAYYSRYAYGTAV